MDQNTKVSIGIVLFTILIVTFFCANVFGGGGGGGSGSGSRKTVPDLSDPVWDMYFECTARQRAGGYGLLEAANRCEKLRP